MSLVASLALAASVSAPTLPSCSWDRPGVNPFMGDVVAAVDRYKDIPVAVRNKLKARMTARSYDEMVSIKRDGIDGKQLYSSEIRDMHFGAGSVCGTVTRAKWTDKMEERGLVYCEDGHCILVPTVCRNVSRITRLAPRKTAEAPAQAANVASSARDGEDDAESELITEAPGAGVPALGAGGAPTPPTFTQMSGSGAPESGPGLIGGGGGGPSGGPGPGPGFPGTGLVPPGGIPDGGTPPVTPTTPVPEPGTWALMLLGLGAMVWTRRRRA